MMILHFDTPTVCLAIGIGLLLVGLAWAAVVFAITPPAIPFAPADEPDGSQDPAQSAVTELDEHQPPPTPAVATPADAWVDTRLQPVVLTADDLYRSRHAADTIRPLSDDQRLAYLTRLRNINDGTGALLSESEMAAMAADPQEGWRHLTPDWREATAGPIPVVEFDIWSDDETRVIRSHRRAGAR